MAARQDYERMKEEYRRRLASGRSSRDVWSEEEKILIGSLVSAKVCSGAGASRDFGVSANTIYEWKKKASEHQRERFAILCGC